MKKCTLLKGKNLAFVMFFLFFALGGIAQTGKTPKSDMRVIARHYPDPNESGCPYVKINWGSDLGDSFFDFETGSIPSYWENDQTYPWVIADPTNYSSYTNSYCIKSGNDSVPNSTSSISATVDYVRTGTVSFSAGCWGEGTTTSIWDKCEFYIDGVLKFKEGAAQVWNDTTFDVNAGTHTFTWSYTKDGSVNEDGDAFFVDNVRFDGIDNSKAWTNYYDVYRTHCSQTGGQIADDRVLVAHEVAVTYAIDSTWINLEEGEYQYVVELLYSTSVEESYSNCITKTPVSEFNIAVAPNPADAGIVTGGGTYTIGTTCTLRATAQKYYDFYAWIQGTDTVSRNNPYSFKVTQDGSFIGQFDPKDIDYSTAAQPANGGSVSIDYGQNYWYLQYNDTITLRATPADGFHFVKWTALGGAQRNTIDLSTNPDYTFVLTAGLLDSIFGETIPSGSTIYFTGIFDDEVNYPITAVAVPEEGGTVTGAGNYHFNDTCTLVATENYGYHFVDWTYNDDEVSDSTTYQFLVMDTALYVASFERNSYPVTATAVPEDGGTVTGAGNYLYGDTCTLVATANTGYTFLAWRLYGDTYDTIPTIKFAVVDTLVYEAYFELNSYDIVATVNPTVGGTVTGDSTYYHGETCTLTATEEEGYTFLNWTENGQTVSTNPIYSFTVNGPRTLTANFSLNSYAITAVAVPEVGGTVTGAGAYNHGENCTLTATENYGYHFLNWTYNDDEVSTAPTYTFPVVDSGLYVANFELNNYLITATAQPEIGGTVTGGGTYAYGDTCTLVATANEGYTFQTWLLYGDSFDTIPTLQFVVNDTMAYVAVFELNSYEITATVNPTVGGTVTGYGTYNHGASCTLTATEEEGYTFLNWTENGQTVSTSATYTFTVNGPRTLTANFSLNSYAITAVAVPEVGGTVTGAGAYNHGENCTLVAIPEDAYHFLNWTFNDDEVSTDSTYTFMVIDSGLYVANFELNSYQVIASANPTEGGTITGAGTYQHGSTCTLTATANQGYQFLYWTVNDVYLDTVPTLQFEVTGQITFAAYFELINYDITAMVTVNPTEGGSVTGAGNYNYGETCTLTAVPAEGYHFVNWTKNGQEVSTELTYTFQVTEAAEYAANFEINNYPVTATAVPEGSGAITGTGNYDHGSNCTLTATATEGYNFLYWTLYGDEYDTIPSIQIAVTDTLVFEAYFELISFDITAMVTVNPTEGGSVTGAGTYHYGDTCTLTANPATGYHFVNWTKNGEEISTDLTYSFLVNEEATYAANFAINSYNIAASANPTAGGTIDGAGTYNHFESCTLTATEGEGYTFVNWTENGDEVATTLAYNFTVEGPRTLVANFSLNSYEITASVNPTVGGTVNGTGTYNHFEEITLTATEGEGYTFVNWTENGNEVATTLAYTFTVTGPRDLVANFSLNSYEITATANPTAGGSVTGYGTYNHFEEITLTATEGEGYTFVNWTENGQEVATTLDYTFTVTGPRDLVANFELNSYDITATASPSVGGSVSGAGTYNHFATCTLTATPATGYHFVNWTKNGAVVTTSETFSFEVTGEARYVAHFQLNRYTIAASHTEGGTVTGGGYYNHFATCTLTATPSTGYHFVDWTLNGTVVSTSETYTFEVTGSASYLATFELNNYNISASANPTAGGEVTGAGAYNHGETCTLTATPNVGYYFVRWTKGSETVSTEAIYSFEVTETATYKAHFERIEYSISAEANPEEGGTVTGMGDSFNYGTTCQLIARANTGYHFVNWTLDGDEVSTSSIFSVTVTESAHYVANFELDTFEIEAKADPEEGGVVTGSGTYAYGEEVVLTAEANTDFTFMYWTEGDEMVSEEATIVFNAESDRHLVAHFNSTVGITEHDALTVSIYPNPAKYQLTIEASEAINTLEVYTINGALVSKQSNCSDKTEVNVESLAPGTYMIRLTTDNTVEIRKFVKE